jgi:hypothetical protein
MKVIAFTLCVMSVFLMIGTITSSDWVNAGGWREGLFETCTDKGTPLPLPFEQEGKEGCGRVRSAGYIRGVGALMCIALLTDFFGTLLTGLGLRSTDPNKKYKYYRVAIYSLLLAVLTLFLVAIIYPVSFAKDVAKEGNNPVYNGYKVEPAASKGDLDFDNDGVIDSMDDDDDNDGIPDAQDKDDDNDGIPDIEDDDDDNDGIPDALDQDIESDGDLDNDGVADDIDTDDDNDGIPDALDDDDDNDGIPDALDEDDDGDDEVLAPIDTDGDKIPDVDDPDIDGDGILNVNDDDDDGDDVKDEDDFRAGGTREFSWGFGYGCTWCCLIFIFISVVLLICDRESEEIFYKERAVEEEEEEEEA